MTEALASLPTMKTIRDLDKFYETLAEHNLDLIMITNSFARFTYHCKRTKKTIQIDLERNNDPWQVILQRAIEESRIKTLLGLE